MVNPISNPALAAEIYASTADVGKTKAPVSDVAGSKDGAVSFGDMLKERAEDVVETLKTSEEVSARAIVGKADITEVVQAVTEAEITVQTMVAVRDKVIAAYQDIMRMPI